MNFINISATLACGLFVNIFMYVLVLAFFGYDLLPIEEAIFSFIYFIIFILSFLHCILLIVDFLRKN